jgi:hypothetical protein
VGRALGRGPAEDLRKCLDGGDALIRQRVQAALGYADTDNDNGEVTGSNPLTRTPPDQVVSQS